MKTLDRYLLREVLPPFLLALGLFTFLLAVNPMLEKAQMLLAKGVDLPTVGLLLLTLLPQALGLTIPMALMAGLLMGLGRLSGDRETVALLACGVSPYRLLRPVMVVAVASWAAILYPSEGRSMPANMASPCPSTTGAIANCISSIRPA